MTDRFETTLDTYPDSEETEIGIDLGGELCNGGYYLIHIPIKLAKRLEYTEYYGYKKRCEHVYVKELVGLNKH